MKTLIVWILVYHQGYGQGFVWSSPPLPTQAVCESFKSQLPGTGKIYANCIQTTLVVGL